MPPLSAQKRVKVQYGLLLSTPDTKDPVGRRVLTSSIFSYIPVPFATVKIVTASSLDDGKAVSLHIQ